MRTNSRLMAIATLFLVVLGNHASAGQDSQAQVSEISPAAVSSGSLDTTFEFNGILLQGFANSGGCFATHVVTLNDGKALVAYECQNGTLGTTDFTSFIAVRRLNEDGSRDLPFGGSGSGQAIIKGLKILQPRKMVVTPEGGIFIAAHSSNASGSAVRPRIYALTAAGTVDSNFAGVGSYSPITPIANTSTNRIFAEDLLYDPATKRLTLGGTVAPKNGSNSFLWTYTVDVDNINFDHETAVGEADANLEFAKLTKLPGGEMLIAAGITPSDGGGIPQAYLVRQRDDGTVTRKASNVIGLKTFITGLRVDGSKAFLAGAAFTNGFQTQGYVARFDLETLTRDTTFGSNGIRFVSNDVRDLAFSLGSGTAQKLIVVGSDGTDYMAARMSYNGQMDTSFGINGITLVTILSETDERALSVSVDSKDRIWAAGLVEPDNQRGFRAGVVRLLP